MSSSNACAALEDAIIFAVTAHRGQVDRSGVPFIFHCLRVMLAQQDDATRIAAVLHDVAEDTAYSLEDIVQAGFSAEICAAVAVLTRRGGEPYESYIERVAVDRLARSVKLADLADNMDPQRLPVGDSGAEARMTRYKLACERLSAPQMGARHMDESDWKEGDPNGHSS